MHPVVWIQLRSVVRAQMAICVFVWWVWLVMRVVYLYGAFACFFARGLGATNKPRVSHGHFRSLVRNHVRNRRSPVCRTKLRGGNSWIWIWFLVWGVISPPGAFGIYCGGCGYLCGVDVHGRGVREWQWDSASLRLSGLQSRGKLARFSYS